MKTQTYIVKIEMPDGDKISPTWLKDLIQSDCDVEDSGRQIVSVSEVIESQGLDEAAEEQWAAMEYASKAASESTSVRDWCTEDIVNAFKAGAKWMAEQGYAREVEVKEDAGGYPHIPCIELYDYDKEEPIFKPGGKIVVQIRKEK